MLGKERAHVVELGGEISRQTEYEPVTQRHGAPRGDTDETAHPDGDGASWQGIQACTIDVVKLALETDRGLGP